MSNASVKTQVDLLERRVAELEQSLVRLTALHRVAQSIGKSPNASRVFVELARELGAALPRVYEVSVSEWDRRRGVIRDIFEFKPQQNRRVAVPGFEFELGPSPSSTRCCAPAAGASSRCATVRTRRRPRSRT